jgi:hypothetical protein
LPGAGIIQDGIDGKIPAGGGLLRSNLRIELDRKTLMARRNFGIFARHSEVIGVPAAGGQFDDAEGAPHQIRAAPSGQRLEERFVIGAKDFDIKILSGRKAKKRVAHATAHQKSAIQLRGFLENPFQL